MKMINSVLDEKIKVAERLKVVLALKNEIQQTLNQPEEEMIKKDEAFQKCYDELVKQIESLNSLLSDLLIDKYQPKE